MTFRTRALFRDAWPVVAAALALSACKGSDAPLVEVNTVEPGDDCAEGGIEVVTGVDEDGDGSLSSEEITASEIVCNGVTGDDGSPGTVSRTTVLPDGSLDCPWGGLQIDSGVDDGSGGGTANDGILQDGEITNTEYVCNGEPAWSGTPTEPPAAGGATYTVDASGGDGTQFYGGDGGYFEALFDYGTIGGGIKVFATGQAVNPLAFPGTVSAYLGFNPAIISSSLTVPLDPTLDASMDGKLYMLTSNPYLRRWNNTDGGGEIVSGVRVESGVTLTLPMNYGAEGYSRLDLATDFHLAGTLTTTNGDGGKTDLDLNPGNWVGEASGLVDLSGADGSGSGGDSGHSFSVYCQYSDPDIEESGGAVFNRAAIDVSGGDGTSGGDSGDIDLEGYVAVYNEGTLTASGGAGSVDNGGEGGQVYLDVDYGPLLNTASITVTGGDAPISAGYGGEAYFYNGYVGWVVNTGDIDADGGSTADCPAETTCNAGDGGNFYAYLYSNAFVNTGDVSARGGNAPQTTNASAVANAGDGGYFEVYFSEYESGWYGDYNRVGDAHVSGNIDVAGGDGGSGGDGGYVYAELDAGYMPDNQEIVFFGYPTMDMSGGDGTDGGEAGYFYMEASEAYSGSLYDYGPGGYVANYATVDLTGGNGSDGWGGDGGDFEMYTDSDYSALADWAVAINHGDVDAWGGTATDDDGGDGGYVFLYGYNGVTNTGDLDTSGADSTAADYWGGGSGDQHLISDQGLVENSGTLTNNGGSNDSGYGGWSYTIEIVGGEVNNSGDLIANGGDSDTENIIGGEGGILFLHSIWETTTQTATTFEIEGGAGVTDGNHGSVFIDGQNVTDDWAN